MPIGNPGPGVQHRQLSTTRMQGPPSASAPWQQARGTVACDLAACPPSLPSTRLPELARTAGVLACCSTRWSRPAAVCAATLAQQAQLRGCNLLPQCSRAAQRLTASHRSNVACNRSPARNPLSTVRWPPPQKPSSASRSSTSFTPTRSTLTPPICAAPFPSQARSRCGKAVFKCSHEKA